MIPIQPILLFGLLLLISIQSYVSASTISDNGGGDLVTVAYYISVDESTYYQLNRLMLRLYHPSNVYLIEYDASVPESDYFENKEIEDKSNIYNRKADMYTPNGITEVINIIDGMGFFLNRMELDPTLNTFDYFIPLTPKSYPVFSSDSLQTLFNFITTNNNHTKKPNFFHFIHPSQLQFFSSEVNTHYVDLSLSFNYSLSPSLHTKGVPHPDRNYRSFQSFKRSLPYFIASYAFTKFIVDSSFSNRLLVTLAETSMPSYRFFSTLASYSNKYNFGPVFHSNSLHCLQNNDAEDVDFSSHARRPRSLSKPVFPNYTMKIPRMEFLINHPVACLFSAPYGITAESITALDDIDESLALGGYDENDPSMTQEKLRLQKSFFESTKKKLLSLLSS